MKAGRRHSPITLERISAPRAVYGISPSAETQRAGLVEKFALFRGLVAAVEVCAAVADGDEAEHQ
jgi:hypothetical protein